MIAIDELKFTAKRLDILKESTDNIEEKVMVEMITQNLLNIANQFEMFSKTNEFAELVKEYLQKKQD